MRSRRVNFLSVGESMSKFGSEMIPLARPRQKCAVVGEHEVQALRRDVSQVS